MKYWDASAVVPLLVRQAQSSFVTRLRAAVPLFSDWWGTPVECGSAVARLLREGKIERRDAARALERLREFEAEWVEVEPSIAVSRCRLPAVARPSVAGGRRLATRAALRLSDEFGEPLEIVSFDDRLADAARPSACP